MVGLGRMGRGMARRLQRSGHHVCGYDPYVKEEQGMELLRDFSELRTFFGSERKVVWMMVPHGAVDEVLEKLKPHLDRDDVVIDGGNSYYEDSIRRYKDLRACGVYFLDVGVSGGVWGEEHGYCLMVGGDEEAFEYVSPLLEDLSVEGKGYALLGPSGAGHFAKMVHNGIEYAMMEAIAEGFELLKESGFEYDLREVARLYNTGSVIRSWLMELTVKVFEDFGDLQGLKAYVEDTGEGRWTLMEAIKRGVPLPAIAESLFMRFRSRQENSFRDRLLAGLRYQFGRHEVKKKDE